MNGTLGVAMFGEELVLVASGDISCFRQSGRGCSGSKVDAADLQGGGKMETNGERECNKTQVSDES